MDSPFWQPRCARPEGLVRPVGLDPLGLRGPTRGTARGPLWRRTSRGWYVPAEVDGSVVEQRILEQSVRLTSVGAVTGWAALRWRGAHFFTGRAHGIVLPVAFALGKQDVGRDPKIRVSRERFWPHEIELVDGVPCAVPGRALFDQMRWEAGLRAAVVAVDMSVAAGLLTLADLADYLLHRNGWTGVPGAREALALASADSRSPQESRLRLVWVLDAQLPTPLCNRPVFDRAGRLLGYPDLLDPVAGLVAEYDGHDHLLGDRRRADAAREEAFRDHGLAYVTLVRGDLADRRLVVRRLLGARRRARFLPLDRRAWTVQPPPWWHPRDSPRPTAPELGVEACSRPRTIGTGEGVFAYDEHRKKGAGTEVESTPLHS